MEMEKTSEEMRDEWREKANVQRIIIKVFLASRLEEKDFNLLVESLNDFESYLILEQQYAIKALRGE